MSGQHQTLGSSPHSASSHTRFDTPSSVSTIVSPESRDEKKAYGLSIPTFKLDNASDRQSAISAVRASSLPSISARRNLNPPAPVIVHPPLSPTAEEFTPGQVTKTARDAGICHEISSQQGAALSVDPGSSTARTAAGLLANTHSIPSAGMLPVGMASPQQVVGHGTFTIHESTSRAFVVTGCDLYWADFQYIATSFKNFTSLQNIDASLLNQGTFAVEFADFNEAKQAAMLTLQFLFRDQPIKVFKLTPKDLAIKRGMAEDAVSNWEGTHVLHVVRMDAPPKPFTLGDIMRACEELGTVKAIRREENAPYDSFASFRVEWIDLRTQASDLNGRRFGPFRLSVTPYTPDVIQPLTPTGPKSTRIGMFNDYDDHTNRVAAYLRQPRARLPANGSHNIVDIDRIVRGLDVRTTIMLRNIPNRVNQDGLKMLLDQTSRGAYDFMYLRIDFANNCNVGYAFVNFVEPIAIVPFAQARAGVKWNIFNSDKVAEISYATIQGRDCLVQKFRNSSVMLEKSSFRPKLYKTGNGPDAGTEEPFPGPDNQAKLKRSCDNAEHVGLYYPPARPRTSRLDSLPPPRNQLAGGTYISPASTRRATNIALGLFTPPLTNPDVTSHIRPCFTYSGLETPTRSATRARFAATPTDLGAAGLYAPREGQAYRERQRRQQSQYDRGTPGAQFEYGLGYDTNTTTRSNSMTNGSQAFDLASSLSALSIGTGSIDHDESDDLQSMPTPASRQYGRRNIDFHPDSKLSVADMYETRNLGIDR